MSMIAPVITTIVQDKDRAAIIAWTMTEVNWGRAVYVPGAFLQSVQVSGAFGTGGTVIMEGTNVPEALASQTQISADFVQYGAPITAASLVQLGDQAFAGVRTRVSAGTSVNVTVRLLVIWP